MSPADIERRQRRHVDDVGILRTDGDDLSRLVEADEQRAARFVAGEIDLADFVKPAR